MIPNLKIILILISFLVLVPNFFEPFALQSEAVLFLGSNGKVGYISEIIYLFEMFYS